MSRLPETLSVGQIVMAGSLFFRIDSITDTHYNVTVMRGSPEGVQPTYETGRWTKKALHAYATAHLIEQVRPRAETALPTTTDGPRIITIDGEDHVFI